MAENSCRNGGLLPRVPLQVILVTLLSLFASLTLAEEAAKPSDQLPRPDTAEISKKDAKVLAEKAFREATHNSIPKYKVISHDDSGDSTEWKFLFYGIEEYERPGFHTLVIVNKRTRQVEVLAGE